MGTSPGLSPPSGIPAAESTDEGWDDSPDGAPTPPSAEHEATVEAALAASSRAEATLGALYRAIQQVTQGVSGAREANEQLGAELHRVREMLASSNEQRLVSGNQVALLEQQLEQTRGDREFLIHEQDQFLAGLLEEHELRVDELVRERDEAFERLERLMRQTQETAPPAPSPVRRTNPGLGEVPPLVGSLNPVVVTDADRDVEKLLVERERSRELLRRLHQQRDDAQAALARVTAERDRYLSELTRFAPSRVPVPRPLVSHQDARRTQPAVPHVVSRTTDPVPADDSDALGEPIGDRMTAPPGGDLERAIALSRPSPPAGTPAQSAPEEKAPLKRKPDPTREPLGSYSLRGGEDPDPDAP